MRMHDVVDLVTSQAPPLRHSIDDIVAAGERVRRRRRFGWASTGVACLAAVAVAAAIGLPHLAGGGNHPEAGNRTAASPDPAAQQAPTAWAVPDQPFTFTFKGYDVGRFHVADPVSVSTGYESASVAVDDVTSRATLDSGTSDAPGLPARPNLTGHLVVYRPEVFDPDRLTGAEKLTVAGRPAFHRTDRVPAYRQTLAWQYTEDAWAALYIYSPDPPGVAVRDLVAVAEGLKPAVPVPAKVPFTMSYVPDGYHPVKVDMHGVPGLDGTGGGQERQYGGALFAKPAPATTGLTAPWDGTGASSIPNNFTIFVGANGAGNQQLEPGQQPPAGPQCLQGFCSLWSADGSMRIQISSERLPGTEMSRILKGVTFASADPATWTDAATAIPVKP